MATAYWCIVEDDRKGSPKKVMAGVLGEAGRLAGANVEAGWLIHKAGDEGVNALSAGGGSKGWVLRNAACAPHMGGGGGPAPAEPVGQGGPKAIFPPVT